MTSTEIVTVPTVAPDCAEIFMKFVAERVAGLPLVNGSCVKLTVIAVDAEWITLEIEQVGFGCDNHVVRGHLHLTELRAVPPADVEVEPAPPLDAA